MIEEQIHQYLHSLLPTKTDWKIEMENQAKDEKVPIMEPVSMHFVMQLVKMLKPKRILEIGTAIGYSALCMTDAYEGTELLTIERDEQRYKQALNNIERLEKSKQISVILGDALEVLEKLQNNNDLFQFIFIDAAKGQYKRFFELSRPLLDDQGVIISDNVLFRGQVVNPDNVSKRHANMVRKLKGYNKFIMNHPQFMTSIIPIGDGVAISMKR